MQAKDLRDDDDNDDAALLLVKQRLVLYGPCLARNDVVLESKQEVLATVSTLAVAMAFDARGRESDS